MTTAKQKRIQARQKRIPAKVASTNRLFKAVAQNVAAGDIALQRINQIHQRVEKSIEGYVGGLEFGPVQLSILARASALNEANGLFDVGCIEGLPSVLRRMAGLDYKPTRKDGLKFDIGSLYQIRAQLRWGD